MLGLTWRWGKVSDPAPDPMTKREKEIIHDLGNALHLVSGFAEVVIARPEFKREESMNDVGQIYENAQRAIVLFRELRKLRER